MYISSKDNPKIKELVLLSSSKDKRLESGLFLIEGQRICQDAINSEIEVVSLFITENAMEKFQDTYAVIAQKCSHIYTIAEEIVGKIADTKTSQGIFVVCKTRPFVSIQDVEIKKGVMILSSLQDPGNVGTIIRTCDALGIGAIVMSSDCPDIYSPKVLRASMGGVFRLPIVISKNIISEIEFLKENGVEVFATTLTNDSVEIVSINLSAVVVGNEGNGLDSSIVECCSGKVMIPISNKSESLNVATAASILAWEIARKHQ